MRCVGCRWNVWYTLVLTPGVADRWTQLQESSDYAARQASVTTFNKGSRWVKKGIALTTAKYV